MNPAFAAVEVLVWDFDGTLYKPNPDLWRLVRKAEYRVIVSHTGWKREKVVEEFEKVYKKTIPSATDAVAHLSGVTTFQAALEMERYYDRRSFLTHDGQLVALFAKLKKYRHFMLANGVCQNIEACLDVLGVPKKTFEGIVTSELVGVNKPDEAGFCYILKKTNLPPSHHLMIGDREAVDLAPAKALGMKTCMVWSKSSLADITVPTVYDVLAILL